MLTRSYAFRTLALIGMLSLGNAFSSALALDVGASSTQSEASAEYADGGAQQASRGNDDIIVTAEFRKENQQKTPIAVTYVSAETLTLKALENVRDVTTRVPGLFLAPAAYTHTTGSYYIRGIGETDSIANQTVGTYVDDVYISRPLGGTFDMNDIENIQVLRGPQGTLYGRNSSAGAIKITTSTPGNEVRIFGEAGGGSKQAVILRGGISGPLIEDKLAAGIYYVHRSRQGLVYDMTHRQWVGDIQTDSLRAKLNFTPSEKLSFLLTGEYFLDNSTPTPLVPRVQPGGRLDPNVNYSETLIENRNELGAVSLKGTFELNDYLTFKSVSAFRAFRQPGYYDLDGTPTKIVITYSDHRNENFSQEFQANYNRNKVHLVVGLFGLYDNFRSLRTNFTPGANGALLESPPADYPYDVRTVVQDSGERTKNLSAYGQLTYDVSDRLHLIAGGRYTHESHAFRFRGNNNVNGANRSGPYLPSFYSFELPYRSWNSFTPKLGVNVEAAANLTSYLTWSQGFKSGGFDGRATYRQSAETPYDPEDVTTWELGIKADLFQKILRTNLALFNNSIKGYQAPGQQDEFGVTRRVNFDKARSRGFELEATLKPSSRLSWLNNLSYLETRIQAVNAALGNATAGLVGKEFQNSPQWQYFSSLDYVVPLTIPGEVQVGAEYFYRSAVWRDITNDPRQQAEAQHLVNLSASYTFPDRRWQVSGTVRNLLNDRFQQGGTAGNGITVSNSTTFNEPRLLFVRVRYSY